MRVVVTGSSGHLGEALVGRLLGDGHEVVGLDLLPGDTTDRVGSIADRGLVDGCLRAADAVVHTATLHKPHVATHAQQDFVDANVTGTLVLLEAAVAHGVGAFVFTSTTSTFGASLIPAPGAPAVWIDEDVPCVPKNIYGATKTAAEDLCHLTHRRDGLPCLVLRTSRFFPEEDDDPAIRDGWADENAKANEFLNRRVDLEDVVEAHVLAIDAAPRLGFGRYVISATTPLTPDDRVGLRSDPAAVVEARVPGFAAVYRARGYRLFPSIDRVYDNARARRDLGWSPRHGFASVLEQLRRGAPIGSAAA